MFMLKNKHLVHIPEKKELKQPDVVTTGTSNPAEAADTGADASKQPQAPTPEPVAAPAAGKPAPKPAGNKKP